MAAATCKTCPFFSPAREATWGTCQLNPPVYVGSDCQWPAVDATEWCGSHPARQRDRLAAMFAQGMTYPDRLNEEDLDRDLAKRAYQMADAMLAARAEGREVSP
jgi:hypothetical protein